MQQYLISFFGQPEVVAAQAAIFILGTAVIIARLPKASKPVSSSEEPAQPVAVEKMAEEPDNIVEFRKAA